MTHGLLTATLPTKIGGEMDYVARSMEFEFHRPVYAGDTVTCEARITDLDEREGRTLMSATFVCHNQNGENVMNGRSDGMIPG